MDTYNNVNKYSCSSIKCFTCNDGFICKKCIPIVDPYGTIFMDDIEEIKEIIKCPCCRTPNWKYHFNQILGVTLDEAFDDWEQTEPNAAIKLYLRNKEQY